MIRLRGRLRSAQLYAESSRGEEREEDEANTVLEALSVVLCALLEPSHVELIGCIE